MRRSSAPSMKRPPEKTNANIASRTSSSSKQIHGAPRKTPILSPTSACGSPTPNLCESGQTIYRVVWGKISSRKHKTWEGDGTLEVTGRSAILKDENGRFISNASGLKLDEVTEGIQIIVGTKEVEVLEKLDGGSSSISPPSSSTAPCKRSRVDGARHLFKPPEQIPRDVEMQGDAEMKTRSCAVNLEPDVQKCTNSFQNVHNNSTPSTRENIGVNSTFKFVQSASTEEDDERFVEPLIMKKPSFEHRFQNNDGNVTPAEVQVPVCLAKHLRPHQREGVAFLYECVTGLRLVDPPGYGAILADEMGLGKTLQCIALMYTLMKSGPYGKPLVKRVLIVTPSSLVESWDREIIKWLRNERIFTFIVGPNNKLKLYAQSPHIPILIISYEMLSKQIAELATVKFDLILCDEGHRLKNSNVKAFGVLSRIECKRRVLLTGTPIQNDLQEFFSLINFVNPGVVGAYQDFKARYETPIVISQRPGVLPQSIELGMERLNELNAITGRFVLRRTQEVINKYLPDKHELVIFCYPSELQTKLTRSALSFYDQEKGSNAISPLQLITILKKICNHPSLVAVQGKGDPESLVHQLAEQLPSWQQMGPNDSAKLGIVEALLEVLLLAQEKIVIVSYFGKTLDMLAGLCEHYNYKYCRLDGTTSGSDRGKIVHAFNSPSTDIFIFLLSAKAGGAGLNLVGASRLVLFDNDWNPANDLQAMSRVWRDGQNKPVFIYRLLTAFSIEERIFHRQISKTSLSGTVVDQKQNLNNLKFSDDELKDLFSFVDPNLADDCLTHSLLECPCAGIGNPPEIDRQDREDLDDAPLDCAGEPPAEAEEESRFRVRPVYARRNKPGTKYALKMQELMRWEHHRSPVSESVLEQLGLARCAEDVVFLFRNIVSASK